MGSLPPNPFRGKQFAQLLSPLFRPRESLMLSEVNESRETVCGGHRPGRVEGRPIRRKFRNCSCTNICPSKRHLNDIP